MVFLRRHEIRDVECSNLASIWSFSGRTSSRNRLWLFNYTWYYCWYVERISFTQLSYCILASECYWFFFLLTMASVISNIFHCFSYINGITSLITTLASVCGCIWRAEINVGNLPQTQHLILKIYYILLGVHKYTMCAHWGQRTTFRTMWDPGIKLGLLDATVSAFTEPSCWSSSLFFETRPVRHKGSSCFCFLDDEIIMYCCA